MYQNGILVQNRTCFPPSPVSVSLSGPEETQEESVWPRCKWAIRPQSLGSVCYRCRRLKSERNPLGSIWCTLTVCGRIRLCKLCVCVCVFVCAPALLRPVRKIDDRLLSTVRWFLHKSEIAVGLWEELGDQLGQDGGWHDNGAPGLLSHRRLTAHGWYRVSSRWHVTLIEPLPHPLAHRTTYSLGQSLTARAWLIRPHTLRRTERRETVRKGSVLLDV